jgi:hypothetical protein
MEKDWFELKDIRKRRLAAAVWIPLRLSHRLIHQGTYGHVGYQDEFSGLGSVAIPVERRAEAAKLRWSDIGIGHSQGVWATSDYYKPADVYQYNDRVDLGIDLVLVQTFETGEQSEWHLNQDLVFALKLMREGDEWVRPSEDYITVARLRRDSDGKPVALEVKNEYLRDYLCARNMFLRSSRFHSREAIVEDIAEVGSPTEQATKTDDSEFELRIIPIMEGGYLGDGGFGVFNVSRTDIDPDEDVPRPGPETNDNTTSRSWRGKHEGRPLVRVFGELWHEEEIEPASVSPRVRGDSVPSGIQYIVDATGAKLSSEELDNEDDPRWLWFRPEVILALTKRRGGHFQWYTWYTGGVSCSSSYLTHFGLNQIGLVTVYAYDIAKLPHWQQQIWAGHNVAPEGGVSKELLSAQMATKVADTTAPEQAIAHVLSTLDEVFQSVLGTTLFRPHAETDTLIASISRFRALEPHGVFSLAKDLMRLVADRIDAVALQKVVPPPKSERWGSLKSLERYLATILSAEDARRMMAPLAGAYDLRVADAHLPTGELDKAYALAGIDQSTPPLDQGFWLIANVVTALSHINNVIVEANFPKEDE